MRSYNLFFSRAAAVGAAGAGVLALGGLACWWFDGWRPAAFGPDYVPMAPSTAILMLALSLAAFLRAKAPASRLGGIWETGCALLALGGGAFFGLRFPPRFSSLVEQWLSGTTEAVGGIPVGRISPLTAGCFVVVAAALLCGRLGASRWPRLRPLGGWLALAGLAVSGGIAAGYLAGAPFLYGGTTIPMALLTALCFVLVSLAALLSGGGDAWPLRMFLHDPAFAEQERRPRVAWSLLFLILLLVAGIAVVSLRYLGHRQTQARAAAGQELEAIAGLKVQQIVNWRRERLTDANLLRATPYAARRALDALAQPGSSGTRAMFTGFLEPLLDSATYESVLVLDADLNVRLVHPQGASRELSEGTRQAAQEALRTRQVAVADLYRTAGRAHVHLDLIVPLVVRREGDNDNVPAAGLPALPMDRSAGLLVLTVDADHFLFPLIQTWPTPSRTAETLLVRREGGEVLFLNELRHLKGSAMRLRRELNEPRLPAARGLRGDEGVFEGVDYRGAPVVTATRAVPGTPWVLVAKVDADELYAPLRREAMLVAVVAAALLLTAVLGVTTLWRRRNEQLLRTQLRTAHERRTLAERFEHLMKSANDLILLADADGRILEANERAVQTYGATLAELQRKTLPDLRAPEARAAFAGQHEALARHGQALFETLHQRRDGTAFPVEVGASLVNIGGAPLKLTVIRDITQRKRYEAEIERLNRLYAALSQINQSLVRVCSREELFTEVCRIIVQFGGFKFAWIGWLNRETQAVVPVASAGDGAGFLQHVKAFADDRAEGRGPIGACIRESRSVLRNDLAGTPEPMPWHDEALRRGFRAAAAFPIRWREAVEGALMVYASEPGVFADKEVSLLEEAAGDIAFALDKLDKEEQRARAEAALRRSEAALRESEERLRLALSAANQGLYDLNVQTGEAVVSPEYARMLGYEPEEFHETNAAWRERLHPEDREPVYRVYEEYVAGRRAEYRVEFRQRTQSGDWKWILSLGKLVSRDAGGKPLRMLGTHTDITERKRAEEQVRLAQEETRRLLVQAEQSREALLSVVEDQREVEAALRDREAFIRSVLDNLPVGIAVNAMNPAVSFRYMNDNFPRFYRTTRNALETPDSFWDAVYEDPEFREAMRRRVLADCASGDSARLCWEDVPITRKGQETAFISARNIPLPGNGLMVSLVWDVTERKRAEEALRRLNTELDQRVRDRTAQLEIANRELEAFSYSVSHDLRAPLRAIDGFARLLDQDYRSRFDDDGRRFLGIVRAEAQRMGQLIDDLLAFSRMSRQALHATEVDVEALAQGVFNECAARAPDRQIQFKLQPLPPARGDPAMIRQALTNLIANAIKYTRSKPAAEIEVGSRVDGPETVYFIRDNGAGFDMKYAGKLFGVFQRLHAEDQFEGTGVGLAIVQRVIHRHGGRVWAEAKPNEGATFYFTLAGG